MLKLHEKNLFKLMEACSNALRANPKLVFQEIIIVLVMELCVFNLYEMQAEFFDTRGFKKKEMLFLEHTKYHNNSDKI